MCIYPSSNHLNTLAIANFLILTTSVVKGQHETFDAKRGKVITYKINKLSAEDVYTDSVKQSHFGEDKFHHQSKKNQDENLIEWIEEINKCPANETHCTPIDGNWSAWAEWQCSTACGEGFLQRFRVCANPLPKKGGKFCVGDSQEEDTENTCNNEQCPVPPSIIPTDVWEDFENNLQISDKEMIEGNDLVMTCSNPMIDLVLESFLGTRLVWYHQNKRIKNDLLKYTLDRNAIVVRNLNGLNDNGEYRTQLESASGEGTDVCIFHVSIEVISERTSQENRDNHSTSTVPFSKHVDSKLKWILLITASSPLLLMSIFGIFCIYYRRKKKKELRYIRKQLIYRKKNFRPHQYGGQSSKDKQTNNQDTCRFSRSEESSSQHVSRCNDRDNKMRNIRNKIEENKKREKKKTERSIKRSPKQTFLPVLVKERPSNVQRQCFAREIQCDDTEYKKSHEDIADKGGGHETMRHKTCINYQDSSVQTIRSENIRTRTTGCRDNATVDIDACRDNATVDTFCEEILNLESDEPGNRMPLRVCQIVLPQAKPIHPDLASKGIPLIGIAQKPHAVVEDKSVNVCSSYTTSDNYDINVDMQSHYQTALPNDKNNQSKEVFVTPHILRDVNPRSIDTKRVSVSDAMTSTSKPTQDCYKQYTLIATRGSATVADIVERFSKLERKNQRAATIAEFQDFGGERHPTAERRNRVDSQNRATRRERQVKTDSDLINSRRSPAKSPDLPPLDLNGDRKDLLNAMAGANRNKTREGSNTINPIRNTCPVSNVRTLDGKRSATSNTAFLESQFTDSHVRCRNSQGRPVDKKRPDSTARSRVAKCLDNSTRFFVAKSLDSSTRCNVAKCPDSPSRSLVAGSSVAKSLDSSMRSGVAKRPDSSTRCNVAKRPDSSTRSLVAKSVNSSTRCNIAKSQDSSTRSSVAKHSDSTRSSAGKCLDSSTRSSVAKRSDSTRSSAGKCLDSSTRFSATKCLDSTTRFSAAKCLDSTTRFSAAKFPDSNTRCSVAKYPVSSRRSSASTNPACSSKGIDIYSEREFSPSLPPPPTSLSNTSFESWESRTCLPSPPNLTELNVIRQCDVSHRK